MSALEFTTDLMEHIRATVQTTTGKTTFVTQAVGRPVAPYCVVHLFGHSAGFENTWSDDNVVTSLYVQVDGMGESWRDSLWMMDRATASIRTMPLPPQVADYVVIGRSSPTPLEDEGFVGVAQRVNVRVTRVPA